MVAVGAFHRINTLGPRGLFISSADFKSAISAIVEQLAGNDTGLDGAMRTFTELYGDVYSSVVVLDAFYGSAVVFLPEFLILDEEWVCAQSGYIHSSGHSVYIRTADKGG